MKGDSPSEDHGYQESICSKGFHRSNRLRHHGRIGWLSDPLTAADQTGALSRLFAWSCLAAAAIALIVAIYFTFRALTIREPQKESDLEFEKDDLTE
jgi:hypothetical protein